MSKPKDKILIVGGYGAVGMVISKRLSKAFPGKVIISGRSKLKARSLIEKYNLPALIATVDLSNKNIDEVDLSTVHTAICCIEYLQDNNFIERCIWYRVNYIELATSYEAYKRLLPLKDDVITADITLVPGVGLMPGLSGVFVSNSLSISSRLTSAKSYVMLGLGEHHGLDAIRFMLNYANRIFPVKSNKGFKQVQTFADEEKVTLLDESRARRFYRFDFADQHIIAQNMPVDVVETRLAFDSRFVTGLVHLGKRLGLLGILSKANPTVVKNWLDKFSLGSDAFAVQTVCTTPQKTSIIYLAKGNSEARATAIISAYIVEQVYREQTRRGFCHMEDITDYNSMKDYLKKNEIDIKSSQLESR